MEAIEKVKNSPHKILPLKEIVEFKKNIYSENKGDLPYIGLENIESDTGIFIPSEDPKTIFGSAYKFEKGDILFPKLRPYLNKVHLAEFGGYCSTEFYVLKAKECSAEYLFTFLNSSIIVDQTSCLMTGNTLPRLQTQSVTNLLIPLPDKTIQNKITAMMGDAYHSKEEKKEDIKRLLNGIDDYLLGELGIQLPGKGNNLNRRIFNTNFSDLSEKPLRPLYFHPFFQENFENISKGKYELKALRSVIEFMESGSRPKGGVSNIQNGIWSMGGEHVGDECQTGIGTPKYIPEDFHKKILRTETKLYDVILVKDGATTGKVGIITDQALVDQNVNEHVFLIRADETEIDAFYLVYYLYSLAGQTQIKREITGATVTGLTKQAVLNIYIPVPPLKKQNKIAQHIYRLREQAKRLEKEGGIEIQKARKKAEKIILESE